MSSMKSRPTQADTADYIQPKETIYRGCRFRSRLEARWAVFFDAADIKWQYELEGYDLPSGPYLPDFFLPEYSVFMEIKHQGLPIHDKTTRAHRLCSELAEASRLSVFLYAGEPRDGKSTMIVREKGSFSARQDLHDHLKRINYGKAADAARQARFEHGAHGC